MLEDDETLPSCPICNGDLWKLCQGCAYAKAIALGIFRGERETVSSIGYRDVTEERQ